MNKTTIGIVSFGVLMLALAPAASASLNTCDPTGTACVLDESFSSGTCSDGYQEGFDEVYAFTPTGQLVYAEGYSYCFGFGGWSFTGSGIAAGACDFNTGACAGASWSSYGGSFGSGCDTYVYAAVVFQDAGCPAGDAPNPGWGTLTP